MTMARFASSQKIAPIPWVSAIHLPRVVFNDGRVEKAVRFWNLFRAGFGISRRRTYVTLPASWMGTLSCCGRGGKSSFPVSAMAIARAIKSRAVKFSRVQQRPRD
jgi:hypothetical protein